MKKTDILARRDILTEQNYLLREEQAICDNFIHTHSKDNMWVRFGLGVVGLGVTLGSFGFVPGMIAGIGALLGSAALLIAPVVKAKQILKHSDQKEGLNIFNMTTKVSRHCAYLERVEEANKHEIYLIDKDLVKDGNPTHVVDKQKYNTKFMEKHNELLEKLNKSSKDENREQ